MYKMTKCNFPSRDHVLRALQQRSTSCPRNKAHMGQLHQRDFGKEKTASEYNLIFNFMWPVSLIHWPCVKYIPAYTCTGSISNLSEKLCTVHTPTKTRLLESQFAKLQAGVCSSSPSLAHFRIPRFL